MISTMTGCMNLFEFIALVLLSVSLGLLIGAGR